MIIKNYFCLAPFNTFGIEVMAHYLSIINSVRDLEELFKAGKLSDNPLVLSKGSNILFTEHVERFVLLNQIWGKTIVHEDDDYVKVKFNAGEFWPSIVEYAVENGWGGIENLTDIPGKIGAAPIQNIGAYGAELKDVFESLEAFNFSTGKIEIFNNDDCEFGYRDSIFKKKAKGKYFITSVTLELSKKPVLNISYEPLRNSFDESKLNEISIKDISKKISEIRASKLPNPDKLNNAGSFFKNPVVDISKFHDLKLDYNNVPNYPLENSTYKIPAGWLIEQCGWKGKRIGNVGVHEKQALVIVKYDDAKGTEILDLAESIRESVYSKFGISLDFEVNVV